MTWWYDNVYLHSAHWSDTRERELHRAYNCCEFCGGHLGELHVHHLTYERLWHEPSSDLVVLCDSCHADAHEFPKIRADIAMLANKRHLTGDGDVFAADLAARVPYNPDEPPADPDAASRARKLMSAVWDKKRANPRT